ncbi:hypothetical protein EDB80DRAFT_114877 [Ilyonectria destructans]|nr:hypothetical protein EDB80DRAFT_114877 [Ilyonectria destructans]
MPTLSPPVVNTLQRLCKEKGINFFQDLPQSDYPPSHANTLREVKQLGETKFDSFATDENDAAPWRLDLKVRALNLAEVAKSCRRRNESTWRFACEHHVLARLRSEVVCLNCRQRLWRSEIEVIRDGSHGEMPDSLQRRQANREPCRCSRSNRPDDNLEARGINRLFGHREDELVKHDPELAALLPKQEKPDAIYGLRPTRNLENLLNDSLKPQFSSTNRDAHIEEIVQPSPFDATGEQLHFPFLLLEAKSGKSDCDWDSIRLQSAFPIWTFLQTQQRLRTAAGASSKWLSGPLVWFLMSKGEAWSVSVTYLSGRAVTPGFAEESGCEIVEVWTGSITKRDEALQLLLIIDYIFDWARDKYRHAIISELRTIASGENDTLSFIDTDVLTSSLPERTRTSGHDQTKEDAYAAYMEAQKAFTNLDRPEGVIRHAAFIESRFSCFFITRDNIQSFFNSVEAKKLTKLRSRSGLYLDDAALLNLQAINEVERLWTMNERAPMHRDSPSSRFRVNLAFSSYLSPQWHIVRELHVIAVAQDALQELQGSRFPRCRCNEENCFSREGHHCVEFKPTYVPIVDMVKKIKNKSVAENLLSAIRRSTFRLERCEVGTSPEEVNAPGTRDFVNYFYKSFKKGLMEPDEPFLRVSKILEHQHLVHSGPNPPQAPKCKPLHASEDGCVLISSRSSPRDPDRSRAIVCAYFIEPSHSVPDFGGLCGMIMDAFETRGVHHTTQDNGNSTLTDAIQPDKSSTPWNIENTYGVTWNGLEFQKMITSFTDPARPDCLTIQGLPEIFIDPFESFACISECLEGPWFDTRAAYLRYMPEPQQLKFIIYKTVLECLGSDAPQAPRIRCCVDCAIRNTSQPLGVACRCCCLGLCFYGISFL